MRTSRSGVALGAIAAVALGAGIPAIAQQQRPESILPPGFGEPAPTPSATVAPSRPTNLLPSGGAATPAAAPSPSAGIPAGGASPVPTGPSPSATPTPLPTPDAAEIARNELPPYAQRSLDRVGVASDTGFGPDAFGGANGTYLETLMRRLSAPVPSRWLSIALRRLLLTDVVTPADVNGADFAAERAWLLLRMGEAPGARALVQAVDTDNYTPKLFQIAMQAALATADPGALCPLQTSARAVSAEPGWVLAQAMCTGLAAQPREAGQMLSAIRRHHIAGGVDYLLAQKVVGAGAQGRQAVNAIDWTGVDRLTAWRYGLATATGVDIPQELIDSAGPQVTYWRATSPDIDPQARAAAADRAAAQGVLSNLAMVSLYGDIDRLEDADAASAGIARDLRASYVGERGARLNALDAVWKGGSAKDRYGRLVATARAAARIAPQGDTPEADQLVAAMLSAGLETAAQRWSGAVPRGGDAWAMLELADPNPVAQLGFGEVSVYTGSEIKRQLFFAGLAGLGRLSERDVTRGADSLNLPFDVENSWTRALNRAVRERQPGTVVLLCAVGMQTPSWDGVPPAALYRMLSALRAVGLDGEARMIAAEAIARA